MTLQDCHGRPQNKKNSMPQTQNYEFTEVRIESTGGVMDYIPSAMGR